MIIVYLIYGLPFFILWTVLWVYHIKMGQAPIARNLWMIALFAIFHGMGDWTNMLVSVQQPENPIFRTCGLALLFLSFCFLILFGVSGILRHGRGRIAILAGAILCAISLFAAAGGRPDYVEIWMRYLLGAPASILACIALFSQLEIYEDTKYPNLTLYLRTAAIGFLFYGLFAGLVVPEAGFFPASFLNYRSFEYGTGLPVELLRAASVLTITFALTRALHIFEVESETLLRMRKEELEVLVKQRTRELEESEERYRIISEKAMDAIITIDEESKISFVNPAAERIFGYRSEEMSGSSITMLMPERFCNAHLEAVRTLIKGGKSQSPQCCVQFPGLHRDGREIPLELTYSQFKKEGRHFFTGIVRDISERKRIEEAWRESEEMYRAIFETASVGMGQADPGTGRLLRVNDRFCEITGYSREELLTTSVRDLTHPDDREADWQKYSRMVRGETPEYGNEKRYIRKDGKVIWVYVGARSVRAPDGKPLRTVGIVMDITERKRAEEDIEKLNADLMRRAGELETAYRDLESFAYAVSHDLKAPTIRIGGFSHILLQDYGDKLDDYGADLLRRVKDNADYMKQLIEDLLSFFRFGNKKIAKTDTDIGEMAAAVYEELKKDAATRDIRFEVKTPPAGLCDPAMIQQVLLNLLSNAIKFTRTREKAEIEMGGYAEEKENIYYVRDNGIGFDMQFYGKLFGLFQRIHTSKQFEGTGVGLVIVKKIVETHGGRVWAEGRPDRGATFYFSLPKG